MKIPFRSVMCAILILMSCHVQGAVVYGLKSMTDTGDGTAAPTHLFRFDLDGTNLVDLGPLLIDGIEGDLDGIAASPNYGLQAFLRFSGGSRLVQIDVNAVTAEVLGPPIFSSDLRGATFDQNEKLWAVDMFNDALVKVSPVTGEWLESIPLTINTQSFNVPLAVDLTVDFAGQMLLVTGSSFYSVNTISGELSLMHTDTVGEPTPPSLLPPSLAGAVYGYSGGETIIAIDVEGASTDDVYTYSPGSGFARELLLAAPLATIDAGGADLALVLEPVESGDYNKNGVVDLADYVLWRDTLGSTKLLAANGNDSGTSMSLINQADREVWLQRFGNIVPSETSSTTVSQVPEPQASALLMLLAFHLAARLLHRFRDKSL